MVKSAPGGLWLDLDGKIDESRPLRSMPAPGRLFYPLPQKRGKAASPLVKEGARVLIGQPLCTDGGELFSPVHASVSGSVARIGDSELPYIGKCTVVEVENDRKACFYGQRPRARDYYAIPPRELNALIRNAGIESEGAGADTVPLWYKLEALGAAGVKTLLLNAVEDEPFLSRSAAVNARCAHDAAFGLCCLLKTCGASQAVLAVSDGGADGPEKVAAAAKRIGFPLEIRRVRAKYPAGDENLLPHRLNFDGAAVVYPGDCYNVCRAVKETCPQISKIISVAGDCVQNPQNLEVKLGTRVNDILDFCGLCAEPERVVLGGVMRGEAAGDLSVPLTKRVDAVLALKSAGKGRGAVCIRCGRCAGVCPRRLLPLFLFRAAVKADMEECRRLGIENCIGCGCCSYVCPGGMPVSALIGTIKREISEKDAAV